MAAATKLARLREIAAHRAGGCNRNCSLCAEADHTFCGITGVLNNEDYQRWLAARGVTEHELGGIFQAYEIYTLEAQGFEVKQGAFSPGKVRSMPPKNATLGKTSGKPAATMGLSLPESPSSISDDLNDYSFLIHGEKKIGKTTLATVEEGVLVLSFDPLRPGLSIMQRHIPGWKHMREYLRLLEEKAAGGDFPYCRIVLDRVDLAYTACQQYICKKRQIDHPSEEDWARAWHALRDEFYDVIIRLMSLPCGTWFICHSEWREQKSRTGLVKSKLVPDLAGRAEETLNGLVDGWFAYDYDGADRVLIVLGDDAVGAGHALDTHFKTPDGEPVREIYMGGSAEESWENFRAAFANEQSYVSMEDYREGNKPRRKLSKVSRKS